MRIWRLLTSALILMTSGRAVRVLDGAVPRLGLHAGSPLKGGAQMRLRGGVPGANENGTGYRSKQELMEELQSLRERRDCGKISPEDFQRRKNELKQEREAAKRVSASATTPSPDHATTARAFSRFHCVTWAHVDKSNDIDSLEDPAHICLNATISNEADEVSGSALDKSEYFKIYGEMLKMLDGQDALPDTYIDFFFERDSVNRAHLRFKSETAKGDWVDWAEELGIQPSMEAIKTGESAQERLEREAADAAAAAAASRS